jgi:hypothetical protein
VQWEEALEQATGYALLQQLQTLKNSANSLLIIHE